MTDGNADKAAERHRYESRAIERLGATEAADSAPGSRGALSIVPYLRAPYIAYEAVVQRLLGSQHRVLELGAGTGLHTEVVLRTGAELVSSDVAPAALTLLERELGGRYPRLRTVVADMEDLPFEADSFDAVVCAGSLSYGDPDRVDAGIMRVLRPAGVLLCVDSLNHSPIYRFNRWRHYRRGERTLSTLYRMPTLERIDGLRARFVDAEVRFFGGMTWAMPLVSMLVGDAAASMISDGFDAVLRPRRSAFKFLLSARGRR